MSIFDDWSSGSSWEDDGSTWNDQEQQDNITTYEPDTGSGDFNWWDFNKFNLPDSSIGNFSGNDSFYGNDPLFAPNPTLDAGVDVSKDWGLGSVGSSTSAFLKDLFTKGSTANTMGQLGTALLSGYQNTKNANALTKAASQADPWASQRPFYQTQAQNAVTDPYSSPIVQAQVKQLQNAQNIKDAAAGRRSNTLTSSPALLAAMAQVAQNYQAQMANQGGANIGTGSAAQLNQAAANRSSEGYISPIAQLFGNQTASTTNNNALSQILQAMRG